MSLYVCLDDNTLHNYPGLSTQGSIMLHEYDQSVLKLMHSYLPKEFKETIKGNDLVALVHFQRHVGSVAFREIYDSLIVSNNIETTDSLILKYTSDIKDLKPLDKNVRPATVSIFGNSARQSDTFYEELVENGFYYKPKDMLTPLKVSKFKGKQVIFNEPVSSSLKLPIQAKEVCTVLTKEQEEVFDLESQSGTVTLVNHTTGMIYKNINESLLERSFYVEPYDQTWIAKILNFKNGSIKIQDNIDLILMYNKSGRFVLDNGDTIIISCDKHGLYLENIINNNTKTYKFGELKWELNNIDLDDFKLFVEDSLI